MHRRGGFYAEQQQQVYPGDAGSNGGVHTEARVISNECSKQVGNECAKQEYPLLRRNILNGNDCTAHWAT